MADTRENRLPLARRIVAAQEDERARIARDLHDQLGQQLTALRWMLERHRHECRAPSVDELDRALALARKIDSEVDFLAWELRPAALDDLGLIGAVPRFLEGWSAHYGVAGHFKVRGVVPVLTRQTEVTIYRVAQEALTNVMKHAHATRVDVLIEAHDGSIVLVVEDNGVGFDPADREVHARGIGLIGIHERAELIGGTAQVESTPGHGTTVYLRCPIERHEASPP